MSILKLPNAGDSATLEIIGCDVVQGEYGEQVAFSTKEDVLYLPKASADRQLSRLSIYGSEDDDTLDYNLVISDTLIFSRTKSTKPGGKPYWNIAKANGKPPVTKPAATSNVPNQQLPPLLQNQEAEDAAELQSKIGDGRKEALAAEKAKHAFAMKHANEFVIKHIVPLYTAVEIGLTGDDCYKQAFTIFKQWEERGLIE